MSNKKKISVIDDSDTNNILCQSIFEESGDYLVKTFASGINAVDFIKKEMPDLLLLDIMLPGNNGISILREVKNDTTLLEIPIMVVSAKDDEETMEEVMNLGAIEYVIKPIGVNRLYEKVENLLQAKQS